MWCCSGALWGAAPVLREGARMRWFHFDGIYMHYELGYKLD